MNKIVSKLGGLVIAGALAYGSFAVCTARAGEIVTLRVIHAPATVPGIRSEPSPAPFYVSRPTVNVRPMSAVYGLGNEPAPPNGCEGQGGGFREGSGRLAGRCFGAPK